MLCHRGIYLDGRTNRLRLPCKPKRMHAFSYDPTEVPQAKPWTTENFKNNPDNFQFAILGDRGGGANPKGTYQRAIEQLNWLQPEFVMSVGDYVEGYTSDPKVMNEQWDEFDGIVKKLEMPFFYVRGNHDINTPITREAWAERRGPKYYHFKYKDVLFIALDTEEPLQPVAPELEADLSRFNDLNINDPAKAKEFAAKVDLMSRVQEIVAGEPPEIDFQEHQIEWFKTSPGQEPGCALDVCIFAPAGLEQPLRELQADRQGDSRKEVHFLCRSHALLRL